MNAFRQGATTAAKKNSTLVSFDSDEALNKALESQSLDEQGVTPLDEQGVAPLDSTQDEMLISIESVATPSNSDEAATVVGDIERQQPVAKGTLAISFLRNVLCLVQLLEWKCEDKKYIFFHFFFLYVSMLHYIMITTHCKKLKNT